MTAPGADYAAWVGRSEERRDVIVPGVLDRLSATLDRDDPPFKAGDPLPPLGHWLFFLPDDQQSDIGGDGHAKRGGFLPPIHDLPRRMWAGSRVTFTSSLVVGQEIMRRSNVSAVKAKEGSSGRLVFVTVRHEIGLAGTAPAIIDEHDIVYRGLAVPAVKREVPTAGRGQWHRGLVPDDVLLFRYSALTFNGHRIHYDRDYATRTEGYPGLVVHGPLTATLLVDLIRRSAPEAAISSFSFRAVSPLFAGRVMQLNGSPPDDSGIAKLWATDGNGRLAMTADAKLDKPDGRTTT